MAKKSNVVPHDLQVWYDRIHNAEDARKKISERYGWDRIRDEIKGDYRTVIGTLKGAPFIPVNLAHAFIRTAIPSLYFRDPKFAVNPQGSQYIQRARILEPVLNSTWASLRMKNEMKKVLADTLSVGMGWIKCGYSAELEASEPPAQPKGKKSVEAKDPQFQTNQTIKNEKIWAYRVSPRHITFNSDESIDPPYDCRWIAHEVHKPLETVKKMFPGNDTLGPSYFSGVSNKDNRKMLSAANITGMAGSVPMVRLYEVTDMDAGQIWWLAEDYFKPLADPKPFPYKFPGNGFQYSMLKFNPVPDEPYPYSDLFAAEPQMWEIMKLLSMALNHIKRFSRQMMVEEGILSKTEEAKFQQGVDGALIKMRKGSTLPPTPIPYPPIQTDLYNILDRLQLLFDNIVGQSAFDRGSTTATKSRTLGEVDTIQRGTGNRSSEKQDVLEDFAEEVAGKIISLKRQFLDVPEFVAVTGMDPAQLNKILSAPTPELQGQMADSTGFQYTGKDIQGKFDISVVAGSMRPLDIDSRNQLLTQILRFGQALGLQPGDPTSNEIGLEIFNGLDMYGVAQSFEQKIALNGMEQQVQQLAQKRDQLMQQIQQLQQRMQPQQQPPPPQGMPGAMG